MKAVNLIFLLLSITVSSFSQIILKKGADREYTSFIREYLNVRVICGYGMMFLATVLTVLAYSGMEYKNAPVIESLGYAIVLVLSFFFLGEPITRRKVLGTVIILCGILVFYI
ncbi:MAG: EamA family transporter [Clostridia bacterium]|nr:EamA family transporter [Clostridia bacterium]